MRHKKMSLPTPKAARAAAGISQRELARRVPTTQATVNRCEQQGRYPRQGALKAAYLRALSVVDPSVTPNVQPVLA